MKSVIRDGRSTPRVEDVPRPAARAGHVLVRTCVSLVSAGTERSAAAFAGMSLAAKAARRPDLVRQVMDKVRRDGVWEAQRAVRTRLAVAESLGYSAAGVVEADGTGLYPTGSLVACAGGGHAAHAEVNLVPRNLVAAVPAGVTADDAAFATVGSVALHAVRLTRGGIGDTVAVLGLGLLGQITVQLLHAAGCRVFGLDPQRARADLAASLGCHHVATDPQSLERLVRERTADRGVDAVVIAASSPDSAPITAAAAVARGRARVVVLGDTQLHLDRRPFYEKELRLVVSRSYGPGRYDADYEERGLDYPYEYVRWTLRRNLEAFLALAPRLRLGPLVTHRFAIADAGHAYDLLLGAQTEPALGILLDYPVADGPDGTDGAFLRRGHRNGTTGARHQRRRRRDLRPRDAAAGSRDPAWRSPRDDRDGQGAQRAGTPAVASGSLRARPIWKPLSAPTPRWSWSPPATARMRRWCAKPWRARRRCSARSPYACRTRSSTISSPHTPMRAGRS